MAEKERRITEDDAKNNLRQKTLTFTAEHQKHLYDTEAWKRSQMTLLDMDIRRVRTMKFSSSTEKSCAQADLRRKKMRIDHDFETKKHESDVLLFQKKHDLEQECRDVCHKAETDYRATLLAVDRWYRSTVEQAKFDCERAIRSGRIV
jgi:hypothetical protein